MKQIRISPLLIVALALVMVLVVACDRPEPQVVLDTPQPGTPQQPQALGTGTPTLPPVEATANLSAGTPAAPETPLPGQETPLPGQETPQVLPPAQETPQVVTPEPGTTPGPQVVATALPQIQPTAPQPQVQPTAQVPGVYTVQPGDTLFSVGRKFGVNPYAIAAANHLPYPYILYPGQQLTIPGPTGAVPPGSTPAPVPPRPGCRYYYYVRLGDNLFRISLAYGVPMSTIAAANGIYNYNLIYAGQTLCIP